MQRIRRTPYRTLSAFSEQFLQREAVDTVACSEFHEVFFRLAPTLEAHHLLHRGFTLFRDGALLFGQFSAVFTQLLLLAIHLYADQFLDVFAAALARCHPCLLPEIPPRANTLCPAPAPMGAVSGGIPGSAVKSEWWLEKGSKVRARCSMSGTSVDPRLSDSEIASLQDADIPSQSKPGVHYRLERVIGRGGFAFACLATRLSEHSAVPVVLKVWRPGLVTGARELAARALRKEAVALGRLNERVPPSPFVVRLLDTGSVSVRYEGKQVDVPWLAIEYVHGGVEGETLHRRVAYALSETRHAFDLQRALRLVQHLADGLEEIHAAGVVHRDLKPSNVLCCGSATEEIFKISDFGIARPAGVQSTFGDIALGTPGYIPPEQLHLRDEIGPWTDVFALAGVLYFTLTGQKLFPGKSALDSVLAVDGPERASIRDHGGLSPELQQRPELCGAIDLCIRRATAADPRARTPSASAFASELSRLLAAEPQSTRPHQRWTTSIRSALRRAAPAPQPKFERRTTGGDGWVIAACAWDGDARCLAATTQGLRYFDGVAWSAEISECQDAVWVARRAPGCFLVVDGTGNVIDLRAGGTSPALEHEPALGRVLAVDGDLWDLALVVFRGASEQIFVRARVAGRWARPVTLVGAALLTSVARVRDQVWLVTGRSVDGTGYAALVDPLAMTLEFPDQSLPSVLVQAAAHGAAGAALAVGASGQLLRTLDGRLQLSTIEDRPSLSAAAVDMLGTEWVAGARGIWVAPAQTRQFVQVFRHDGDIAPIVSMHADVGRVLAVAADGTVFAGREQD